MAETCFLCARIADIKAATNPYFVTELPSGYVVLGDFQCWRGYSLLLSKTCVSELHMLPIETRRQFLADMSLLAEAVWDVFRPDKLNYEMLGNQVSHLHWHIFPRQADEPDRRAPVWERYAAASKDPKYVLPEAELLQMKNDLAQAINRLRGRA